MNEVHRDAVLGGTWSWDLEDDESFEDPREQVRDLLREFVDVAED